MVLVLSMESRTFGQRCEVFYSRTSCGQRPGESCTLAHCVCVWRLISILTFVWYVRQSGPRPSLSLVIPPSLSLQDAQVHKGVDVLLQALAPVYLVHILHYAPDGPADNQSSNHLKGLHGIDGLDIRRVLAYSQPAGAEAAARAIGCDMHVEVLAEDKSGDPVLRKSQALSLIRRNGKCRLFAALLLPSPGPESSSQKAQPRGVTSPRPLQSSVIPGNNHSATGSQVDELISALLNPGGNASASSNSQLAALRIVDVRGQSSVGKRNGAKDAMIAAESSAFVAAAREAAARLLEFRSGWK